MGEARSIPAVLNHARKPLCLVVEDEPKVRLLLAEIVRSCGWAVVEAGTVVQALQWIRGDGCAEVMLLDYGLPDGTAEEVIEACSGLPLPPLSVIVTAFPEMAHSASLVRSGLFGYVRKPFDPTTIRELLERAQQFRVLHQRGDLVAHSAVMQRVVQELMLAAQHGQVPVLLSGETGTGKEVCARFFHQVHTAGDRSKPFVDVNCGALPSELVEAEIFGAERGAYTGAQATRIGLAEQAGAGTLFLDEIGELPLVQQAKFLRFLESRQFRRLGGRDTIQFEGRLVAATNRDLSREVAEGRFRADLWYRLNLMHLRLPPLRERPEDIPELVKRLLGKIGEKNGMSGTVLRLHPEDLEALMRAPLLGNVRELRNLLESAVIRMPEGATVLRLVNRPVPGALPPQTEPALPEAGNWVQEVFARAPGPEVLDWAMGELALAALKNENGNISAAARRLGILRERLQTILRKMPPARVQALPRLRRGRPRLKVKRDFDVPMI